jgi:hypothetical protein
MMRTASRFASALLLLTAASANAQATVTVTVPPSVGFFVTNVSMSTTGSPNPATLSYTAAVIPVGQVLQFSLKADASAFTSPSPGAAIAASDVSWATSSASGGTGFSGTLSDTTWGPVFTSTTLPVTGSVDLTFTLAPPAAGIRSGAHTLTMRWKIESM